MKNWSTDTTRLEQDQPAYMAWKLEQLINFGLGNEKLSEQELRTHWNGLHIDPFKTREYLSLNPRIAHMVVFPELRHPHAVYAGWTQATTRSPQPARVYLRKANG